MKNAKTLKLIQALWLLGFIFFLFSGCSLYAGNKEPESHAPGPDGTTKRAAVSDRSRHFTVSVGYWDIQQAFMKPEQDAFLQKIQKDYNITLQPVQVSWTDYEEKYRIMAATGTLPDISANTQINTPVYEDWIRQGILRPIPENLEAYPHVKKIMELPDVRGLKYDGKFYMIPRTAFIEDRDLYASNAALLVRKDWMEKLGIADPKNFDEFVAMLKAFAEEDPDGNGVDDTEGLCVNTRAAFGKWVIMTIHPQFNLFSWVKEKDRYVPSCAAEDFPGVLVKLRRLYDEGVLDKDFAVQATDSGTKKFARGQAGALEYHSAPGALQQVADLWYKNFPQRKFSEYIKILHVFPAEDGNLYHNTRLVYWSESYFSANVSDGKMERILELYDELLSPEGQIHLKLGLEGKDYKMEDGKLEIMRPREAKTGKWVAVTDIYPSVNLFGALASWGGESMEDLKPNAVNSACYDEDILEMAFQELQWNLANTKPISRPYEIYSLNTVNSKFSAAYIMDDVTRVILGKEDPVEMWREVVKKYEAEGLKEAIEEVNAIAAGPGIR